MISKHNKVVRIEVLTELANNGYNFVFYDSMPKINLTENNKNFMILKQMGQDYKNAKNVLQNNQLDVFINANENNGENTTLKIMNIIKNTLEKFTPNLINFNAEEFDAEIEFFHFTINYKTYC